MVIELNALLSKAEWCRFCMSQKPASWISWKSACWLKKSGGTDRQVISSASFHFLKERRLKIVNLTCYGTLLYAYGIWEQRHTARLDEIRTGLALNLLIFIYRKETTNCNLMHIFPLLSLKCMIIRFKCYLLSCLLSSLSDTCNWFYLSSADPLYFKPAMPLGHFWFTVNYIPWFTSLHLLTIVGDVTYFPSNPTTFTNIKPLLNAAIETTVNNTNNSNRRNDIPCRLPQRNIEITLSNENVPEFVHVASPCFLFCDRERSWLWDDVHRREPWAWLAWLTAGEDLADIAERFPACLPCISRHFRNYYYFW
jgi:hypothetical protein